MTYTGTPLAPEHPLGGIYAIMDSRGMLPDDIFCTRCAKPLNADGNHPAELYAGTYNGLCYGCTSEAPYVAATAPLDGCQRVSWQPKEPSHRRDRTDHYGYPDCENCHGLGAAGSPYYARTCDACLERYSAHPARVAWGQWSERIMRTCQAVFERAWDREAGVPRKCTAARRDALRAEYAGPDREHATEEFRQLKADYQAGYSRIRALIRGHFEALGVFAWTETERDPQAFWLSYCKWRRIDPDIGLAYGYPEGFRYAHQPKPLCRRHAYYEGCTECLARVVAAQTLQRVEDWFCIGHVSIQVRDAYRHVWATSAHRYSDVGTGWEAEPDDPQTIRLAALMRRALAERKQS